MGLRNGPPVLCRGARDLYFDIDVAPWQSVKQEP